MIVPEGIVMPFYTGFLFYAADSVHCGSQELARPQMKRYIVPKPTENLSLKSGGLYYGNEINNRYLL